MTNDGPGGRRPDESQGSDGAQGAWWTQSRETHGNTDPTVHARPSDPYYGQVPPPQQAWSQPSWQQPQYVPPQPQYAMPPRPPMPPRRSSNTTPVLVVVGALVAVVVLGVVALVAVNAGGEDETPLAATTSVAPTTTTSLTTTKAAPTTTKAFDPTTLDSAATDTTPLTVAALLPQTYTDAKGIVYTRKASGEHGCTMKSHSDNINTALTKNGCVTNITGSYIDKDEHILVSVNVLVFPDRASARAAYDALDGPIQDWGIWCPTTGLGSTTCDGDLRKATHSQWSTVDHRYFTQATGVYIDLSKDNSLLEWCSAGAKAASSKAGPSNYAR
ncbi:hypothetical protein [Nocardia camponoti]|uniref:Uncharacterized protein n=1 Tax=Nocardia camponoti TaxID=1616106 RepID=A0A917QFC7_9NOCA|nr:hypothetical protein [Nocardia camponoti]GGK48690.1 hypothetical protein GCM10011591_20120 [Nocardia camponoti]